MLDKSSLPVGNNCRASVFSISLKKRILLTAKIWIICNLMDQYLSPAQYLTNKSFLRIEKDIRLSHLQQPSEKKMRCIFNRDEIVCETNFLILRSLHLHTVQYFIQDVCQLQAASICSRLAGVAERSSSPQCSEKHLLINSQPQW